MGLIRAMGRTAVVAGTATAVSNRVSRRQADRWNQQADAQAYQEQQAAAQQAPPPQYAQPAPPPQYAQPAPAAAPASTSNTIDQLTKLGELKAAGVLTDAEFEAQKAKIIAG